MEQGRPFISLWRGLLLSVTTVLFLCGCAGNGVMVNISSDAHCNPDNHHHGLPVVVRLFQLNSASSFKHANFHSLWKYPAQTLASTLVSSDTIIVMPNRHQHVHITRHNDTQFIGVMALFRDERHAIWRRTITLHNRFENWRNAIHLRINNNQLLLAHS